MSDSLVSRVLAAAETLTDLQDGSVTHSESYTPDSLRRIARMMEGGGER